MTPSCRRVVIKLIVWLVVASTGLGAQQIDQDIISLRRQIILLYRAGQYREALPIAQKILSLSEQEYGPEQPDTAISLNDLGLLYEHIGDFTHAELLFKRALDIRERVLGSDHEDTAISLGNLAQLYIHLGDYLRAEVLLTRSLKIKSALGPESASTAIALNDLALLYDSTGDYSRAEPLYTRALGICEKIAGPEHPDTAQTLNNLGVLYGHMGDYGRAESVLQRALQIREKALGPQHIATAETLNNLGVVYSRKGDLAGSTSSCLRALKIYEEVLGPDHLQTALAMSNLAQLYQRAGLYAPAETLYLRALRVRQKSLGPEALETAYSLNNLALLYHTLGDDRRSKPLYEKSLRILKKVLGPDHPDTADCTENLAYAEISMGDVEAALTHARLASATQEKTLSRVLSFTATPQRLAYQATLQPYDLFGTMGSAPDLATAVLRRKGVVLDSLLEDHLVAQSTRNADLHALFEELTSARQRLIQLTMGAPLDSSAEGRRRWSGDRDTVTRRVDELEGTVARKVTGIGLSRRSLHVTVRDIQGALQNRPGHPVLVEFLRYNHYLGKGTSKPCYGAVVLSGATNASWVSLGAAAPIDEVVKLYQQQFHDEEASEATVSQLLRRLYVVTWQPVAKRLPPGTQVVILSPDSQLHLVSFATLLSPQGRFLAEQYTVEYVAGGRDLLRTVPAPSNHDTVIYANPLYSAHTSPTGASKGDELGLRAIEQQDWARVEVPPLPGTAAECAMLETLMKGWGWATHPLLGESATEGSLGSLHGPLVLHFATHGFFLDDVEPPSNGQVRGLLVAETNHAAPGLSLPLKSPMHRSGLALAGAQTTLQAWGRGEAPDPRNDGILTAEEVGALDLRGTWLVALSACDTGRGEIKSGEGVLGLRRGFVQAGARNLLLTLWPVSDNITPAFMHDFYTVAHKTGRPELALAEVQRDWLIRMRKQSGILKAVSSVGPFVLTFQGQP